MNVAIFGSSSFVGRALVRQLSEAGHHVEAFGNANSGPALDRVELRRVNVIEDEVELAESTDVVYYLPQSAAYRNFPDGAEDLFGVNLIGAIKAARASRTVGARLFCYTSTGSVYQPGFDALAETHPLRRDDHYALSKIVGEEALTLLGDELPVVSARLFGVFGPGQTKMLPYVIHQRVMQGDPVLLAPKPGDSGTVQGLTISYLFVDDAARCLGGLAERAMEGAELPRILNVAGPEPVSLRQFASAMAEAVGRQARFEIADAPRAFDLIADISRLRALLDPEFKPFDEAITSSYGR